MLVNEQAWEKQKKIILEWNILTVKKHLLCLPLLGFIYSFSFFLLWSGENRGKETTCTDCPMGNSKNISNKQIKFYWWGPQTHSAAPVPSILLENPVRYWKTQLTPHSVRRSHEIETITSLGQIFKSNLVKGSLSPSVFQISFLKKFIFIHFLIFSVSCICMLYLILQQCLLL